MSTKDFDYEKYAKDLKAQAENLLPEDLNDEAKNFLLDKMENYVKISAQALCNDSEADISAAQIQTVCQIVAEWTFNKTVDLAHSKVPMDYWEPILQKIAYIIFEISKSHPNSLGESEFFENIETQVQKGYTDCLNQLKGKGVDITPIQDDNTSISKINLSSDENYQKKSCNTSVIKNIVSLLSNFVKKKNENVKKYTSMIFAATLVIVIAAVLSIVFIKYNINFPTPVVVISALIACVCFLVICYIRGKKIRDCEKELIEVKRGMQRLIDPNKMYERFGMDVIALQVGANLLEIADPDQGGELLPKIAALRQTMTDEYGYVIPNIRLFDSAELEAYEYEIFVRGWVAGVGYVYPNKYMVTADEWDKHYDNIPEDCVIGVDPIYKTQVYWICEHDYKTKAVKYGMGVAPTDVIIKHVKECALENVNYILEKRNVLKLSELVRSQDPTLVNDLMPELISATDIRKIFVNLIREKVSIKDIVFIFEKLGDYARYSKDPDFLSEHLRIELRNAICLGNAQAANVLYAVSLSDKWERILDENWQKTELGSMFLLKPDKIQDFIEDVAITLLQVTKQCNVQPVVLCSPKIRLALYKLLVEHIPTIVVMSYSELSSVVKVEEICKIGD